MFLGDKELVAGSLSGICARLSTHPLDVVKIRLQVQREPVKLGSYYSGFSHCILRIWQDEGIRGLYRGLMTGQFLSISYTGMQFWSFKVLEDKVPNAAVRGYASGFLAVVISQPVDMIRTRLIAQSNQKKGYRSTIQGLRSIIRHEGFFGLWRGINCNLIMTPLQTAINFSLYTNLNDLNKSNGLFPSHLVNGGVAGLVSKVAVYPLDLARKRMEIVGFDEARKEFGKPFPTLAPKRFLSLKDFLPRFAIIYCLYDCVRIEGVSGMFKGLSPSLLKAATSTAITFSAYELFKNAL